MSLCINLVVGFKKEAAWCHGKEKALRKFLGISFNNNFEAIIKAFIYDYCSFLPEVILKMNLYIIVVYSLTVRRESGKRGSYYSETKIFNSLPLHLKTEKHYIHFKKSLKEHFMD